MRISLDDLLVLRRFDGHRRHFQVTNNLKRKQTNVRQPKIENIILQVYEKKSSRIKL